MKLGNTCKYAPVELLSSMGAEMVRITPSVNDFNQADISLHPNLCSYVKGVLEDVSNHDYDGIILTSCCDSTRRLYDVLKAKYPDKFIYLLDLPRTTDDLGTAFYRKRLEELIESFEKFSGNIYSDDNLLQYLKISAEQNSLTIKEGFTNVGLIGARTEDSILRLLEKKGVNVAFDITCTGLKREFSVNENNPLTCYAESLLNQVPCLRMDNTDKRNELIREYSEKVDGIIYHSVKFCDTYPYEYSVINRESNVPVLMLETDYTTQSAGQILTRTEAFLESIGWKGNTEEAEEIRSLDKIYVIGVDSGSTSTNAVIMDGNKNLIAFDIVRTGAKSGVSADTVLSNVLAKAGLKREEITRIVATGYGRVSIPYADEAVTEISCHGRGAHYFNPNVRTILDIGGQDSKAIHLNEKGEVIDFVMNDKCAAGTGRFLEMIARTLDISVAELGPAALQSKEEIEITSMCTVFAESEVISLIAQNKELSDIANGVCRSIANKSFNLLKRINPEPGFMMTGGVAKNPGVVRALEDKLNASVYIAKEPEIVGAVGAALYALDKFHKAEAEKTCK